MGRRASSFQGQMAAAARDGDAAGVEDMDEFVAVAAGEFLVLGDVVLGAVVSAEGVEEALNDGDFLRGLEVGASQEEGCRGE